MSHSIRHDSSFWDQHFGKPEGVKFWNIYGYEYLDDLAFMPAARDMFGTWPHADAVIEAVGAKFRLHQWAGDGVMQMLWLPPFTGAGPHQTFGCYALHVKQLNDGISWIGCPYALPFHRLFQPDGANFDPPGTPWSQRGR